MLQNEFAHLARVNDLGEMAAAIAHEVNQPLTAITNYLNAGIEIAGLSGAPRSETGPEPMMERAAEQALRAGHIVRRLREFIGKGTGEREDRFVDQLIDGVTEFAAVDAAVNGVAVVRKAGAAGAMVSVDVVQFQQVVVNLIRNAIDALSTNPPGAERKLTVETKIAKSRKAVEFIIADTGPGISPDIRPKLFEPFTTSKANGMGMGLSVCRRLIEAHGGSISIEVARRWRRNLLFQSSTGDRRRVGWPRRSGGACPKLEVLPLSTMMKPSGSQPQRCSGQPASTWNCLRLAMSFWTAKPDRLTASCSTCACPDQTASMS